MRKRPNWSGRPERGLRPGAPPLSMPVIAERTATKLAIEARQAAALAAEQAAEAAAREVAVKAERSTGRQGYRSGYGSQTELFERYQRSAGVGGGAGGDVLQGVSTRKVKAITEELCGHSFSASSMRPAFAIGELDRQHRPEVDHAGWQTRATAARAGNRIALASRRPARPARFSPRPLSSPHGRCGRDRRALPIPPVRRRTASSASPFAGSPPSRAPRHRPRARRGRPK